jgi:2-polyprenyl-3-methyl-5-hydroxy-6-metoxy-1,4-benzoquinol methylase
MKDVTFTGERLHAGDERFSLDIARHRAAYEIAREHAGNGNVIDVGCGSGYGTTMLAESGEAVFGIDRVLPDRDHRGRAVGFIVGDLRELPLEFGRFDLVVSFQVIEHLDDPSFYVDALANLCSADGLVLVTTPNILTSDGVNPYHVHEYTSDELASTLGTRFEAVDVQGIRASDRARRVLEQRSQRIRRVMRLDPLRLRDRLPRPLVEWLFAQFALLVRRPSPATSSDEPEMDHHDFPAGDATDDCLDLLAMCRKPR